MTPFIPQSRMHRVGVDDFKRETIINIEVNPPRPRKTPRTPEYVAMIENIDRAEPLPPALGDIIERMKAQMVKRLGQQFEESAMRAILGGGLQPYQREAIDAMGHGEVVFYRGGRFR